jgi:DNA-binding NarL/FixJ family response regulator
MSAAVLSIASVRDLNSFEATGLHRRGAALDDLILSHLSALAELRKLSAHEELVCRYLAEGYTRTDIAKELGCTWRTVDRHVRQVRWSLFGVDAADALAKQRCAA